MSKETIKGRVSVIVPNYNHGDYIIETLDSVAAQTFTDWECIVIDDGSEDGSADKISEYCRKDNRFKFIALKKNVGVSAARNRAIAVSEGEFILPLDSDDIIYPEYLSLAVGHFERHPETKLVYSKAELFGEVNGPWPLPEYKYEEFIFINCIFCSCVFRRSDFDRSGGYDETMLDGYEDWDFLLTFLRPEDRVYRIDKVLFRYRQKNTSKNTKALSRKGSLEATIIKKHPEIYSQFYTRIIEMGSDLIRLKGEFATMKRRNRSLLEKICIFTRKSN